MVLFCMYNFNSNISPYFSVGKKSFYIDGKGVEAKNKRVERQIQSEGLREIYFPVVTE